jgi:hypothetical protein
MEKLDHKLLDEVKQAFVPMSGEGGGPVAGSGMMTAAQAAPMAPPGMDPMMGGGGMPMDPMMGGGTPPMDPMAGGGMPPGGDPMAGGAPPMDPMAAGGDPMAGGGLPPELGALLGGEGGAPAEGQITMSATEFKDLITTIIGAVTGAAPKASKGGGTSAKLDAIAAAVGVPPDTGAAEAPAGPPAE